MKKSELRHIIREEIKQLIFERRPTDVNGNTLKVGQSIQAIENTDAWGAYNEKKIRKGTVVKIVEIDKITGIVTLGGQYSGLFADPVHFQVY